MNKLKRRILAGTAAAAMLLWNFADLPQGALGSAVLSAKAAIVSAPVLTGTAKTAEPSMIPFEKDTFHNRKHYHNNSLHNIYQGIHDCFHCNGNN